MFLTEDGNVEVWVRVIVRVDPTDPSLLESMHEAAASFAFETLVKNEIQSNLESVPYVRSVEVK